jgi:TolB-like protein/class 3 adenylate cyclase/rhodanese-related sulfurtransferase
MVEPTGVKRKLAVILAADAEGYTRLMREAEEPTLQTLTEYREIIDGLIARHDGRIFGTAGDSVVAEFGSAVEAVRCALSIQEELAVRNAELSDDRKLRFRIGINVGDVMAKGDDLFGDGVNVAARLEGLAEPGGICVSASVFEQVKHKLSLSFEDIGSQAVKNVAEPVLAFRIVPGSVSVTEATKPAPKPRVAARWRIPALAAVGVVVVAVGGVALWQTVFRPALPPQVTASEKTPAPVLPDKPSLAVLPFTNMSDDVKQEYFSDGITQDIITDLSKISGLFAVARNSTFVYNGKPVKVSGVAKELGVRYVLEGSVRKAGERVRINAQLIDSVTGGHLWAERYDGTLADIFALQDKVTEKIVAALAVKLTAAERALQARGETGNPEAHDAFLRGWAHYRRNTPEDFAKAIPYFKEAIGLDPNYSRAHAALATVYWDVREKGLTSRASDWVRSLGLTHTEAWRRANRYLKEAMKDPVPLAHQVASRMLSFHGRHDEAIAQAGRAIALAVNDPVGYEAMAIALIYAGRAEEGASDIAKAMRLDPHYPPEYLYWRGLARFGMQRYEVAAESLTRAAQANPDDDRALLLLAAAYGHLGRGQKAGAAIGKLEERLTQLRERRPQPRGKDFELGVDALLMGSYTLKDVDLWPFKERADRERLREGLRKAGLPKGAPGSAKVSPTEVEGAVTVSPAMAKALLDRGARFVDVRSDAGWNLGHIPGAVHLELKKVFGEATLSAVVGKDQEVVIHCAGPKCLRSAKACAKAVSWGFEKVYYFRDGFPGWKAAGYPVALPQTAN